MTKEAISRGVLSAALGLALVSGGTYAVLSPLGDGIGSVQTASAKTKIKVKSGKAACKYVKKFLKKKKQYVPKHVLYDRRGKVGKHKVYVVHCYDIAGDRNMTSGWYSVTKKGAIYDEIFMRWVKRA